MLDILQFVWDVLTYNPGGPGMVLADPGILPFVQIGTSLLGTMMKGDAASESAQTLAGGYQQAGQAIQQALAPYAEGGLPAFQRLAAGTAPGGEFTKPVTTPFTMETALTSPAMRTALEAGGQAIQGSAAAKGGLLGTNTLADLTTFGQKVGSQYEQQAFDQWLQSQGLALRERQAQLQPLEFVSSMGGKAAGDIGSAIARAIAGGAEARAAGQVSQADIWSGGIQDIMGLSKPLFGGGGAGSGGALTSSAFSSAGAPLAYDAGVDLMFSDERLKTDIRPVGRTYDGESIYTYKMKGGGPTQMGVMAQDLERTRPQAVRMHPSGYRMVDYDMVS